MKPDVVTGNMTNSAETRSTSPANNAEMVHKNANWKESPTIIFNLLELFFRVYFISRTAFSMAVIFNM